MTPQQFTQWLIDDEIKNRKLAREEKKRDINNCNWKVYQGIADVLTKIIKEYDRILPPHSTLN